MGDRTGIEWTDATWNPQVGCSRVSRGCQHCYAETQAAGRLVNSPAYRGVTTNGHFNGTVNLLPDRLDQPLRWRRPRLIFVNSMSDLFHENVPTDWIARVVGIMARSTRHTFQVLTKRPERMVQVLADPNFRDDVQAQVGLSFDADAWPLPHVWWGVSVEADRFCSRVDVIRHMPAAVRWVSAEPLVGPLPSLNLDGIGWVVVGGESGRGAEPMHPEWARDIRDRCVAAGVPFLFKQWGEWAPAPWKVARSDEHLGATHAVLDSAPPVPHELRHKPWSLDRADEPPSHWAGIRLVGKKAAGRELDGRTWDEYPS